jgi:hypothetical protein
MKPIAVAGTALFTAAVIVWGCALQRYPTTAVSAQWQPWTNPVTTAKQLSSALEVRWQLEMIRAYCEATPPTPDSVQNLVALGEEWHGTLHEDRAREFNRIWWYASTRDGQLDKYSVNAAKGRKHWIIEIGNEQSLSQPPVLSRP